MKPEETIDFPIRWAWHRISRLYNAEAAKSDLTMSIGYALLNIDSKEGTPSTKLGPKMGMEPRSLTRTLKTMEETGLIERVPDPNDKRMVRIQLTEKGRKKRDFSREVVIQFNQTIQEKIAPGKLKVFFEVINKLNEILDNPDLMADRPTNAD